MKFQDVCVCLPGLPDSCKVKYRWRMTLSGCTDRGKLFVGESFAITTEACELLKPMQFGKVCGSKHLMNIDAKYLLPSLKLEVSLKMF